jgi:hypothetical protein
VYAPIRLLGPNGGRYILEEALALYSDEISSRIPVSESSCTVTQKEYLKAIYGN